MSPKYIRTVPTLLRTQTVPPHIKTCGERNIVASRRCFLVCFCYIDSVQFDHSLCTTLESYTYFHMGHRSCRAYASDARYNLRRGFFCWQKRSHKRRSLVCFVETANKEQEKKLIDVARRPHEQEDVRFIGM